MVENIVVAKFNVESEAYQAKSELQKFPITSTYSISQLAVVKRIGDSIEVKDSFDSGVNTQDDTLVGGLVGSLVGIIGGPFGILISGGLGALIGSTIDDMDKMSEDYKMEHVSQVLNDGETAIVALVQEEQESALNVALEKFKVDMFRFDAVEVATELQEIEEQRKIKEKEEKKAKREKQIAERNAKINEMKAKIDQHFANIKNKQTEQK